MGQEAVRMLREVGHEEDLHFGVLGNEVFGSVGATESVNQILEAVVIDIVDF